MVSADASPIDITRHEVAHIVTREATRGPFGLPDWMNEGISVFAQRRPLPGHEAALQAAIRSGRVLTMNELNSPSVGGSADTVGLYYGQAGDIVRYLVDTYGRENFAGLLAIFRDGATPDDAFRRAYGAGELDIENGWRQSVGLEPRVASATATPPATERASGQPTRVSAEPAGARDGGGDGFPVVTAIIIAVLALALAASGLVAVRVMRERA
jgi:hypothetical protein